jgi:hypothetical protein
MTSNVAAATTLWNLPNYDGDVFQINAKRTPFLDRLGGLGGVRSKRASSFGFSLGQAWELEAASQPDITETASLSAGTPETYVTVQAVNCVQPFKRDVSMSYQAISDASVTTGLAVLEGENPIKDKYADQITKNLRQIAVDMDYSFLIGTYQAASSASVSWKTRGVVTAMTTNKVNASSAALTKTHIDNLMLSMANAGAPLTDPVMFCNAFQKQALSAIYGWSPVAAPGTGLGGTAVQVIETDFARIPVVFEPQMTASIVSVIDMAYCYPVFLPVRDAEKGGFKGPLFYEPKNHAGAGVAGMLYGQAGIDYGHESYHGQVYGLTTS